MPPMVTSPHDTGRSGARAAAHGGRRWPWSRRERRPYRSVGFAELVDELVGVPAHRRIEHLQRAVVVRVAQHLAGADELETGGLDLLAHQQRIDAVQGIGVAQPGTVLGAVVDDDVDTARLQRLEHRLVEHGRVGRAHEVERIVAVVLRGARHGPRRRRRQRAGRRHQQLDVGEFIGQPLGLLRVLLHRLRHGGVDLAVRTDDGAEHAGPVAAARHQLEHGVARLHPGERHDLRDVAAIVVLRVLRPHRIGNRGRHVIGNIGRLRGGRGRGKRKHEGKGPLHGNSLLWQGPPSLSLLPTRGENPHPPFSPRAGRTPRPPFSPRAGRRGPEGTDEGRGIMGLHAPSGSGMPTRNNPSRLDPSRTIRAPRGPELTCRSWLTEAPFRMLQNNLDPEVAENPAELVVYGGIGRAARNWECYDAIIASLKTLGDDETLLVQSGKPVGILPTHAHAPRVLPATPNRVPPRATWEHFSELDQRGLMMYGQMTAGSWIYIGSQGIVQGTYETFVEMGRQHYGGDLTGKWILTAGLGGMGGAQPLAASLAGACSLNVECQQSRIDMRLRTRYVDEQASDLDDALARIAKYTAAGEAKSIALLGNAAEILPQLVERGVRPDAVTDQTSAHDPVHGYLPAGWTVEQWLTEQKQHPEKVRDAAKQSMRVHVEAMLAFEKQGIPTFDYGNNLRQMAADVGCRNAFDFPGFVPAYVRPLFCKGIGPFRWVALSGDPEDIY